MILIPNSRHFVKIYTEKCETYYTEIYNNRTKSLLILSLNGAFRKKAKVKSSNADTGLELWAGGAHN